MPRHIDADKTIGHLKTRLYETALNNATVQCDASYLYTECADNRIETWINEMPTVDAESVKRGRWIKVEDDYNNHLYECSYCHTLTSLPTEEVNDGNIRYCWSCGAKMGG